MDTKYKIFEIPVWTAYEITGKLKSTVNNRFSVGLKLDNDNTSKAMARIGAYTSLDAYISSTTGAALVDNNAGSYTANTDVGVKFVYNNGNMKLYINNVLISEASIDYYPIYLMLHSYNASKTVSVSDMKIKSL